MGESIRRKGVVGTLAEALTWLRRHPVLLVAYILYGLLEALIEVPGILGGLFAVVALLVLVYADGLSHAIGAQEVKGEHDGLGRASTAVLYQYPSLFALTVIYVLAVAVGLVFLVLPGLYLAVRLSLALPACVIDGRSTVESLETSWAVAEGDLTKLFGITLSRVLVFVGATFVAALVPDLDESVAIAVTVVLTAVVGPVVQLAYARVYLENRPRSAPDADGDDRREKSAWIATGSDGPVSERGSGRRDRG